MSDAFRKLLRSEHPGVLTLTMEGMQDIHGKTMHDDGDPDSRVMLWKDTTDKRGLYFTVEGSDMRIYLDEISANQLDIMSHYRNEYGCEP